MCDENSCKDSGQTKDVAQKDTCVKNKRGLVQMFLDNIDTLSNSSIFRVWILDILIILFLLLLPVTSFKGTPIVLRS